MLALPEKNKEKKGQNKKQEKQMGLHNRNE